MAYGKAVDHVLMDPKGHVSRNKVRRISSADARDRHRATIRSEIATSKFRAKLHQTQIVQGDDSSWCHVIDGLVVARFSDVRAAIAAL